jgi:hypothetical protein
VSREAPPTNGCTRTTPIAINPPVGQVVLPDPLLLQLRFLRDALREPFGLVLRLFFEPLGLVFWVLGHGHHRGSAYRRDECTTQRDRTPLHLVPSQSCRPAGRPSGCQRPARGRRPPSSRRPSQLYPRSRTLPCPPAVTEVRRMPGCSRPPTAPRPGGGWRPWTQRRSAQYGAQSIRALA